MVCTYFILLTCVLGAYGDIFPVVKIPDGKIQGQISTSYGGREYIEFFGIPYAKPPVGDLRFEEPQPLEPWKGTWIANVTSDCIQVSHLPDPEGGISEGTEDCLHLNIFVPGNKINPENKLDVIVHIHGGAFMFGSGNYYSGPKHLLDHNVILVTPNYRVGVMGFLSTGDKYLPGNMGLKDQTFALQWIKDNIRFFGGNSESITLTGLSAGGSSTHFHYLSPLSKGLYNQGISTSGCALNSWALQEDPLSKAKVVARAVGCPDDDTKKLVKCLKSRPASHLNEATRLLRPWLVNPYSPLGVVVDKASKKPFLPEHPYKLLVDGKVNDVPWIVSTTTSEGLYPAAEFVLEGRNHLEELRKNWDAYAPAILHYMESVPDSQKKHVSETIKEYYLKGAEISKETFQELVQLIGDRLFVVDIEMAAKLQAKANKSPVYFYKFDYTLEKVLSVVHLFTLSKKNYGVCHGDDMMLVFSHETEKLPSRDLKAKETLIDLWINYAKTGKPNIENWKPVSKNMEDDIDYLYFGPDMEIKALTAKEFGHRTFWESLPFEENANLLKKNVKSEL